MCLISNLPKGTKKYTEEVFNFIKSGMSTNRDGSGFMYKRDEEDYIGVKKGYFDYDSLIKEYKELDFKDEDIIVFHHRWGTSGDVTPRNCHPFYLSKDFETCVKTEGYEELMAFVHNGVFTIKRENLAFSDTYAMCNEYFSEPEVYSLIENKPLLFQKIMKDVIGYQKLSFLSPVNGLITFGNFIEDNGYSHSNGGYKTTYYDRGGINYDNNYWDNLSKSTCPVRINSNIGYKTSKPVENNQGEKKKLLMILDSSVINITEYNFSHFYFKLKDDQDDKRFRKNILYKIEKFDNRDNVVVLWNGNEASYINKASLLKVFLPAVKMSITDIYSEYLDLCKKLPKSKNTLKKVKKLLDIKVGSAPDTVIIYKKTLSYPYACFKIWYDKNSENLEKLSTHLEEIYY